MTQTNMGKTSAFSLSLAAGLRAQCMFCSDSTFDYFKKINISNSISRMSFYFFKEAAAMRTLLYRLE